MPHILPVPVTNEGAFFVWSCQLLGGTVEKAMPENLMLVRARRGLYEGLFTLTTWEAVTIMNRFY